MIADLLRPPSALDPAADAYKDWLHLNVFDHASGAVMLLNGSLHGSPNDRRCRAIGTALLHMPDRGWAGNVEVRDFHDAVVGASSIAMERLAIAVDGEGERVLVSASFPDDMLDISVAARADARPITVEERLPFGPGWISWYAVPRLSVSGTFTTDGQVHVLADASGYHDHNWGRWHWGEDLGWEWAALLAPSPGPALVVSCVTDRAHRSRGEPMLVVESSNLRRRFRGSSVEIRPDGRLQSAMRRLPGGLAALHQDRVHPSLPARVDIRADDGVDRVDVELRVLGAAQLIAGEPMQPGYGFIHELVGDFCASSVIAGERRNWQGLAVFEYVD